MDFIIDNTATNVWENVGGDVRVKIEGQSGANNLLGTLSLARPDCTGDFSAEGQFACQVTYGFSVSGLPVGCCGLPPGSALNVAEIFVWRGIPVPNTTPPVVTPRCPENTPEECCPPAGGGPGTGGPSGGPGGGGPSGGGPRSGGARKASGLLGGKGGGKGGLFGGGNECCSGSGGSDCGCTATRESSFPIAYSTGELSYSATDLESDGFGVPWGHTRSFVSRLSRSESIGNGFNWQIEQWPYLVIRDDEIVAQGLAGNAYWFDKDDDGYSPRFSAKKTLIHDAASNVYRFFNRDGSYIEFDVVTGMFRRHLDSAGNKVEVTNLHANGYNFTNVERSCTSGGSTTTEQYHYEYINSDGDDALQRVTLRRKVDAGAWDNVSQAEYSYYGVADQHGAPTDLRTVTTRIWEDGDWIDTGTTMYRYYKQLSGSSSSSSSSSSVQELPIRLLKYVVNPASYQRLADDPQVSDPLTATDFQVSQYADLYFEYDEDRRVTKEIVQGGSRTFTFAYSESGNADGSNSWKTKTVETLPGGTQNVVYSNYAGQTMLHVFKDGDDEWLEFWKYDDDARAILHANPSAISGYDDTKS
ncbi:MAG: hypothetical protein ABI614_19850, partial [Planctomycetota bacterium]